MLAGVLASHSRVVVTITDATTTDFVMIMRRIRLTLAAGFMCLTVMYIVLYAIYRDTHVVPAVCTHTQSSSTSVYTGNITDTQLQPN